MHLLPQLGTSILLPPSSSFSLLQPPSSSFILPPPPFLPLPPLPPMCAPPAERQLQEKAVLSTPCVCVCVCVSGGSPPGSEPVGEGVRAGVCHPEVGWGGESQHHPPRGPHEPWSFPGPHLLLLQNQGSRHQPDVRIPFLAQPGAEGRSDGTPTSRPRTAEPRCLPGSQPPTTRASTHV